MMGMTSLSSVNKPADVKPFLIYGENRADGNALEGGAGNYNLKMP
jgi:hypothetical protein